MKAISKILLRASRSPDVILACVMAAILMAMVMPLPPLVLDIGIALNLAVSVTLLVAALYAKAALKVAAFPTVLLLTTLFRLALNVSSTRLALSEGHAGDIIQAFGEFVVRGDYVVGTVIFAILTLVQFLVVAKGAERVAEVSARFTLDAMPGKQMSIDADLRAGAIDQAQARARRRELERESQMFGAMDGAMKFVKGDVIAGLIIVLVNLIGGTFIGIFQNGMELAEAAGTFALIAIGDGLVSQIPSLCITVAAGLVVTRVAAENDEGSLGSEIGAQFFGQYKAVAVASGLCLALALVPGMPRLLFLGLGGLLGWAAYHLKTKQDEKVHSEAAEKTDVESKPGSNEAAAPTSDALPTGSAPLMLDLAPDVSALVEEEGGAFLKKDLNQVRDQIFFDLGVRIPPVRVRTQAAYLPKGGYAILVDEVPCAKGQTLLGALYALVVPTELAFLNLNPEAAVEPSTGRQISRLSPDARSAAEAAHIPVKGPKELILDHLSVVLRQRATAFLGIQEVQALLDGVEAGSPALVKEALGKVPLPLLTDVLKKLLHEQVSIRNMRVILEALVSPTAEGDAGALAERCRQALHRYITHKYAPSGPLYAYLVDPSVEHALRSGTAMDPGKVSSILESVRRISSGGKAVLLAAPDVRRTLRKLCEGTFPEVAVLTYGELDPELQIRPVGRVSLGA